MTRTTHENHLKHQTNLIIAKNDNTFERKINTFTYSEQDISLL